MATNPAAPQYEGESEDAAKGSTSPPSTPRGASPADEVDPDASGSVAKGAANAAPIRDENLDDSNPGASAAANPQRSGVAVLSMAAAFDTAVPEEVVNANYNQFRARELHDPLAGMTDGSGSLRNFFLFMQGLVDENGNPRTEDGNDDDGLSDYIDAANDREERREEMRRDVEATMSEAQIDSIPWQGDANSEWSADGLTGSRKIWAKVLRNVRSDLPKIAAEQGWSAEYLAHQQRLASDAEVALRNNDEAGFDRAINDMDPKARQDFRRDQNQGLLRDATVSEADFQAATGAGSSASTSAQAGSSILSGQAEVAPAKSKDAPRLDATPALSNPPDIALTEEFTIASDPAAAASAAQPAPISVASMTQPSSSPANTALSQNFSL